MGTQFRIAAIDPEIADLLLAIGAGQDLCVVSTTSVLPKELAQLPRADKLSEIVAAKPTHIFAFEGTHSEEELKSLPLEIKVTIFNPRSLDGVFQMYDSLGTIIKRPIEARQLKNKMKAQFMDWADNFYDRMKNKKVVFFSSLEPLLHGGFWIPDLIKLCSAVPYLPAGLDGDEAVSWKQIVDFRPDVIIIAVRGKSIEENCAKFVELQKNPIWETLPAVKRGEVIFADGKAHFYHPTKALRTSMAVLVSAIAGFESGYITERNSFYKLRYVELQRHRFIKPA